MASSAIICCAFSASPNNTSSSGISRVPLDQCWYPAQRGEMLAYPLAVELPHRLADRFTVGIYPDLPLLELLDRKAGQVDLLDGSRVDGIKVSLAVKAMVEAADIDVVEVKTVTHSRYVAGQRAKTPIQEWLSV